jgi:hypothetical protein
MKNFILFTVLSLLPFTNVYSITSFPEDEVVNAYIYGFPLIIMDTTKDVLTATPTLTEKKAPINQFLYKKTFPDPSFTEVVSPNADTLYSQAWLDLSKEPIILSVPAMGDRYYLFPMLDEWTNVFFSPGTRTTGNGKGDFAIVGPSWKGTLPAGVKEVKSPTDIVWIIGRIQTNGPSDYAAVNKLQVQFKLTPLSAWGTNYVPPSRVALNDKVDANTAPIDQVLKLNGPEYFTKLARLLKQVPIPAADSDYVSQFSKFGLVPGKDFDVSTLTSQQIQDLNVAVKKAQDKIKENWVQHPFAIAENNWGVMVKDIGDYGTNYLIRAAVAFGGLGANLPEDAIYPATTVDSTGQLLNGKYRYVVHFDKGQLPPVGAFWSLTMYNEQQFFYANSINRYAIGDRDKLKFNEDGSLDLYIQHASPGSEKESNWLPSPEGNFNLLLRLYAPKKEALNGTWKPPEVKRVD